jgi:hypothetical protein
MKEPADGTAGGQRGKKSLALDSDCPWPCLYEALHIQLVDDTGHARATLCTLCDQALSHSAWQREFNAVSA